MAEKPIGSTIALPVVTQLTIPERLLPFTRVILLKDWIDIALFYSSLTIVIYITSLYAAIHTTHITHRVQHAH